jgi:hypothetical protein
VAKSPKAGQSDGKEVGAAGGVFGGGTADEYVKTPFCAYLFDFSFNISSDADEKTGGGKKNGKTNKTGSGKKETKAGKGEGGEGDKKGKCILL